MTAREALARVSEDVRRDAKAFDGALFNGDTVGRYFGRHGAAIAVVADLLGELYRALETQQPTTAAPVWPEGPYTVTFERIGRTHDVEPLIVAQADGPNHLADQIHAYARRFLGSRDTGVTVNGESMTGHVTAGWRIAGTFTIKAGA